MKTTLKALALILTVFVSSCSDKNNPEPEPTGEKIFKVEIQYTGDIEKFQETAILQITSTKASSMKILEKDLDKEIPSNDVVWFTKPNGALTANSTYTTSEKASSITLAGVITPVEINPDGTESISATIKFYADGKLKDTKTFTSNSDITSTPFSFPVSAN